MAEERNVAMARVPETAAAAADPEVEKVELQRRMEEARESITQTVTEIKETVVNQYQQVRESISDSLDWREQYRRHTVPFTVGAAVGGAVLGYAVGGAVFGRDDEDGYYEEDYDVEGEGTAPRAYAAQPILGQAASAPAAAPALYGTDTGQTSARARDEAPISYAGAGEDVGSGARASSLVGSAPSSAATAPAAEEPKGPGLFERFKETKAYDRLQQELYTLGDRAVEELSKTARTVVLPALLGKVKDMIGIDLSTQREVAQRAKVEQETEKVATASASGNRGGGQQSSGQGF